MDKKGEQRNGLVLVFTGDGKGKTTAALGLALRAVGHGWRVLMIQFIKNKWRTGELAAIARLAPEFTAMRRGAGFTWQADSDSDTKSHERAAQEALALAHEAMAERYDMVILDEVCMAAHVGLVSAADILDLLDGKPAGMHLVLTGRGAPEALIERADLVTEMCEVKHHYRKGVKAQKGIEF